MKRRDFLKSTAVGLRLGAFSARHLLYADDVPKLLHAPMRRRPRRSSRPPKSCLRARHLLPVPRRTSPITWQPST